MSEIKTSYDDVIQLDPASVLKFAPKTSTVAEFAFALVVQIGANNKWATEGMPCRRLGADGGGWQKGRVRFSLEFIPDEPLKSVAKLPPSSEMEIVDAIVTGGEHE